MKSRAAYAVLLIWGIVAVAGCSLHPSTDELAHHEKAVRYERAGRFDLAAYHYRKAIEVDPDYAPLYASLGYVYLRLGKFDSARAMLDHAVEMDSSQYEARINRVLLDFMRTERPRRPAVVSYFLDPTRFDREVRKVVGGLGLPSSLILAIAKVESNFDPFAYNALGAGGLMQLMPETARTLGLRVPPKCRTGQPPDTLDPRVDERFHPLRSIEAATKYLDELIQQYRRGNRLDLYLPLAAYNVGPNAVGPAKIPAAGKSYAKKVARLYKENRDDDSWIREAMRKIRDKWADGLKSLGIDTGDLDKSTADTVSTKQVLAFATALQELSREVDDEAEAAQILADGAAILSHAQQYEQAAQDLRRAFDLQPDSLRWLAWASDLLLAAGLNPQAENAANEVIERDSTMALPWVVLGESKALRGDFVSASSCLERAVGLDNTSSRGWNDLGVVSLLQLQPEKSQAMLRRAVVCDSLSFLPWYNLAVAELIGIVWRDPGADLRESLTMYLCDSLKFYDIPEEKQPQPFDWPADGPVTSAYGWRPDPFSGSVRNSEFHTGIDIDGGIGDPVIAPADGVVKEAREGYNGGYGNMVILEHDLKAGRFETGYHHLNTILVEEGEEVRRGQKIGTIGNTGRSTGSHLHFMVWRNNVLVNPLLYLKPRAGY